MAERRYVIARQERGEFLAGPVVPVLDLPDAARGADGARHWHVTERADGGWDAVPMVLAIPEHDEPGDADAWWVDAPEQGDDR